MARHAAVVSTSGIWESDDIPAPEFSTFARDVRRSGGRITRSAPVTVGGAPYYAVTVFYA